MFGKGFPTGDVARVFQAGKQGAGDFGAGDGFFPETVRLIADQNRTMSTPPTVSVPRKITEWPDSFLPTASVQKIFRKSPGRAWVKSVKLRPSLSS